MASKAALLGEYVPTILASPFQLLVPFLLVHLLVAFYLSAFDFHTAFVADHGWTVPLNHFFDYTIN